MTTTEELLRELVSANISWREAKQWREEANKHRGAGGAERRLICDAEVRTAYERMLKAEHAALKHLNG